VGNRTSVPGIQSTSAAASSEVTADRDRRTARLLLFGGRERWGVGRRCTQEMFLAMDLFFGTGKQ
jgi:hypothetical protein